MNQLFEQLFEQLKNVNSNLDLEKFKQTLELHKEFGTVRVTMEKEIVNFVNYILGERNKTLTEKNKELTEELTKEGFFTILQKDLEGYNTLLNEQNKQKDGEKTA